MRDKLTQAMDEISDAYLVEAAANPKKRSKPVFFCAIAAAAAIVILVFSIIPPVSTDAAAIALAEYPGTTDIQTRIGNEPADSALMQSFVSQSSALLLNNDQENAIYSPTTIYTSLAMLAECTDGSTRQQILDVLDSGSISDVRKQTHQLWTSLYWNDGTDLRIMANSLWLDDTISCKQATADLLAQKYYASAFRVDFGSEEGTLAMRNWLNEQTGNLLQQEVDTETLSPQGVLTLISAVNYKAGWLMPFSEENSEAGIFQGATGEEVCTFLCEEYLPTQYFQAENFGAINLPLTDGSTFWLFLPNADLSAAQLATDPQLTQMLIQNYDYPQQSSALVRLKLPKFDVRSQMDLKTCLQQLGVTHIFDSSVSDFSTMFPGQSGLFLDKVSHANRVILDENGVSAAGYTLSELCGAGMLPEETVDFILDRPFLFAITASNQPLFLGIVNTLS